MRERRLRWFAGGPAAFPLVAAALPLSMVIGCRAPAPDPARPDLVLVVVDTLRADHLGCYGYFHPTSPHLDAMAGRGVLFEQAWSAAPWTLPSIMSIMTSLYPSQHRVENDGLRLAEGTPTLAALLRDGGYATGGFVAHVYVSASFGFDRGFETFDDFGVSRPGYRLEAGMEPTAERVTDAALAWLRKQHGKPVFLFVHYFDPHWPYAPPARFLTPNPTYDRDDKSAGWDAISRYVELSTPIPEDYRRFLLDRYDGEIRFVDEQVGRLVDGLRQAGRSGRTWIAIIGDHGEEFKDHGSMGHGRRLYEEVVHVPLLIAGPEAAAGGGAATARPTRVPVPVSGIDLAPTFLDLAGLLPSPASRQGPGPERSALQGTGPHAASLHGTSLRALLSPVGASAPALAADRPLLSETARLNAFRKAIRSGAWKLIRFMDENRTELYDLATDPAERRDLAGGQQGRCRHLMQAMFSMADMLSGSWNLRWTGDGRPRRFSGRVTTTGTFRSIVPLFTDRGKYILEQENELKFADEGQTGWSGLSFTTAPGDAPVTFFLAVDDRPARELVALGGGAVRPPSMPFTLEGSHGSEGSFRPPELHAAPGGLFTLWRTPPAAPDQPVILDDETRERLRSLGYID